MATGRQKRKRASAKRKPKRPEAKPHSVAAPATVATGGTENRHEKKAAKQVKENTKQSPDSNRSARKAYRMSAFLSVLLLAIVSILAGIAVASWQKGGYKNYWIAFGWGIAAYVLFGVGVFFTYYYYVIKPAGDVKAASDPYTITMVTGMGTERRAVNIAPMWFSYRSKHGPTISPIHRIMFIRFTNLQPVRSMIETYRVESQTARGDWVKLIRLDGQIGNPCLIPSDPKKAIIVDMPKLDNVLESRNINPRETVEGAAFFELPEDISFKMPFRIYVKDFGGAEMTQTFTGERDWDFGQGVGFTPLTTVDLSGSKYGYYSDAMR